MAKVLFVLYVPCTETKTLNEDVIQTNNNSNEKEEIQQAKDSDDVSENLDNDINDIQDTSTTEVNTTDSLCGGIKEKCEEKVVNGMNIEDTKEEAALDDPKTNVFFKNVKREESNEDKREENNEIKRKESKEVKRKESKEVKRKESSEVKRKESNEVRKEDSDDKKKENGEDKRNESNEVKRNASKESELYANEETSLTEPDKELEMNKHNLVRFLSEDLSLIEKVKRVLDDLNVKGVQWNITEQNVYIGMFVANYGSQCESILRKLSMLQIGVLKDSSVSIFPASISSEEKCMEEEIQEEQIRADEFSERVSRFKHSIKARLVVDQVVNAVKNDAVFTFDFLMLVILASFVALMGLLESSSVVLVASMLISPLMGPILAGVFGVVIRKTDLIHVGIINEIAGLAICVFIGFVIGFIPAGLEAGKADWRYSSKWPTPEMSSRGALRALPVGILIAVPSGAGVALSILGGKVGSLVGVAISASLLPPAVNAGLLWANAIVAAISPLDTESLVTNVTNAALNDSNGVSCARFINNDYEPQYFCSMAKESLILGLISLLLTILNIFCIILMGIIVLKIKEVAPIPHSIVPESESEFFCQDIKIARESNITMKGQAAATVKKEWLKSYQEMKALAGEEDEEEDDENELENIINDVEGSPSVVKIYDKMLIHPPRWSQNLNIRPRSNYGEGKRFDFPSPCLSLQEDAEHGMELRFRAPGSSQSKTSGEVDNTVYYTTHAYMPTRDILKGEAYSYKRGKLIKKLKLPKASRFMVARVMEDESTVAKNTSVVTETETDVTQPLLATADSKVNNPAKIPSPKV